MIQSVRQWDELEQMPPILKNLDSRLETAVAHYWKTLHKQGKGRQGKDWGTRSHVTGGKQMDGFTEMVAAIVSENGMPDADIHLNSRLELPGFFRATKKWDLVVVHKGKLVAALELKSQAGPSFGNNFNNRAEEAIGTGKDLWSAYENGAFDKGPTPWLGWVMLLEDCKKSRLPHEVKEPHFKAFSDFRNTSYAQRYELLFRRLVRERLFTKASLILSARDTGKRGKFTQPAEDLRIQDLFASLAGHVGTILATKTYT